MPWAAARSVAVWKGERAAKSHAKWQATAREAAKQSRRSWLPDRHAARVHGRVAALVAEADLAVVLHEDATVALAGSDVPADGSGRRRRRARGRNHPRGARRLRGRPEHVSVRLGDEVLRTSTAGVVAVAALLSRTRRWS